ncbi:hypothetical protein ER308_08565 [Egibacter rhizosphaerae]|uniref:YitT family protein n=1 Tax=Egibacter rhizosphaerae TaxID=1670831 RepID=A0A411YEF8_9ACTN|nr:hypothetical protein [Egibacter rhizosphaerae]QBI19599.1 hypothetical protein ER308_08565 [Egibacter rhizosphaerae]
MRLPVFTGRARPAALAAGVLIAGFGISSMLWAELGIGPYDLLIDGVATQLGVTFGVASVLLSGIVTVLGWRLGGEVGPATVLLVFALGPIIDLWGWLYPEVPELLAARLLALIGGLALAAYGLSMVIAARFGAGPVEVLMLALTGRGWSVGRVRTVMELTMFLTGWLLGGAIGLGTVVIAVSIGHLFSAFLPAEVRGDRAARESAPCR